MGHKTHILQMTIALDKSFGVYNELRQIGNVVHLLLGTKTKTHRSSIYCNAINSLDTFNIVLDYHIGDASYFTVQFKSS